MKQPCDPRIITAEAIRTEDKPETLEKYRRRTKRAAKELGYARTVLDSIEHASDIPRIITIMERERHRLQSV